MKLSKSTLCFCSLAAVVLSGCEVSVRAPGVYVQPPVVAVEPAVEVVPAYYVWDGVEFVGEVNGRYMYFGPGGGWVVCDPFILDRFNVYVRYHPDWREHMVRNDRENRLDRAHRAVAERRAVAQHREGAPAAHRDAVPAKKAAPAKKAQKKEDDRR